MGNSPSKTSNVSPRDTHTATPLSSSTTAPASEPEPDDRRSSSLSTNPNANYSQSNKPAIAPKQATGVVHTNKYSQKVIQRKIPSSAKKFTYVNEQHHPQTHNNEPDLDLDLDMDIAMSLAKVLKSSPTETEYSRLNGGADTEVSSSFSDVFTIGSSSSSLSVTPPMLSNLPPILEEGKSSTGPSSPTKATKAMMITPSNNKSSNLKKLGFDIDSIIEKLLSMNSSSSSSSSKLSPTLPGKQSSSSTEFFISPKEISHICSKAREVFLKEPSLLRIRAPVKVVGDIHGQFNDLLRILKLSGFPPHSNYLFLGDYVDRGRQSLETLLLMLCFKIKYPENFFMLRGNHESANVSKIYGFYDECKRRLNTKCWKLFVDVFNTLPITAIINDKIFCVHGGLSPHLNSLKQIEDIQRPTDIPESGLLADLLWSDPDGSVQDWSESDRGVSFCFGKKVVDSFIKKFNFDLVIRGHMVVEDGYEFFAKRKLVTVFSAPNYCGEFNNWGAVMSVDHGLMCSFELLKPNKKVIH